MLLDRHSKPILRAGLGVVMMLAAAVTIADTYQFPLTVTSGGISKVSYKRSSLSPTNFSGIRTGQHHTVAVTSAGAVWTWGDLNSSGQLGRSTATPETPGEVTTWYASDGVTTVATPTISKVAAGNDFCVALASDGNVYWWGSLAGATSAAPRRVVLPTTPQAQYAVDIAAGGGHTLMSTNRLSGAARYRVYAWGNNTDGQCGVDPTVSTLITTPTSIGSLADRAGAPLSIGVGENHSMVVEHDGLVLGFGDNSFGQLGTGTTTDTFTPTAPTDQAGVAITGATRAAAGYDHTVILKSGLVMTAGNNSNGQLGRTSGSTNRFETLSGLSNITMISAGYRFNLAVDSLDTLYNWGFFIRSPDYADSWTTPRAQAGFTGISAICAGDRVIAPATNYNAQTLGMTGGFTCVVATGTSPLLEGKLLLDQGKNEVYYLTGGASGYLRFYADQVITDSSGLTFSFASDSPELLFSSSNATIPQSSDFVDVPISTLAVATRTIATFTLTQTSDWSLPNRPVQLRAPKAISMSVANADPSMTLIKGGQAMVTVTLNYPAPTSGYTLSLQSSNEAVLSSGSVTFEAGATEATAYLDVQAVATGTIVKLSALNDGPKLINTVRVVPAGIKAISLPVTSIQGGLSTILTITLDSPAAAGAGGTLSFTDMFGNPTTLVSGTSPFTLLGGELTFDITLDTTPVLVRTPVNITATVGPVTRKVRLGLTR